MPVNFKDTSKQAAKKWTPEQIAESVSSAAKVEYLIRRKGPPPVMTVDQAEAFLRRGEAPGGELYDIFERWCERRTGFSNIVGMTFDPPVVTGKLGNITPPVILPEDWDISREVMPFNNVTNERARQKMLGKG